MTATDTQREMDDLFMEATVMSVSCRSEPCRRAASGLASMVATWSNPHREYLGRYWMQHRHWSEDEIRDRAEHVRAWFRDVGTWTDTRMEAFTR